MVEFVKENEEKDISQSDFDKHHESWCESIMQTWERDEIKGASYGRAAKLLAVYIKSMIVVRDGQSKLSAVAHPPIDRMILKNISKDESIKHQNRGGWKEIKWTKMNKSEIEGQVSTYDKPENPMV